MIVILFPLSYQEWSEEQSKVIRTVESLNISADELFVHKLVDGTLLHNRLWAHISNETEDDRMHFIYVSPYEPDSLPVYGHTINQTALGQVKVTSLLGAEFVYWNGRGFEARDQTGSLPLGNMELARMLLDHYMVRGGITYEVIYSVFDMDRRKVLFYLKDEVEA
ncbi:hypothetical protein [Paenibacillus sp. J22TS3]|uniref:hypothetical protein n=1 Tax=Paenibacillus sp. J22TS3 TaxID=2807192 RepID=UPI001B2AFCEC|nr:hypothetical protein [Paenibacillus sp. J22TS3]GIP23950.1 hypothetical protein J22TS3_42250 [Paenibacillus sp. J22TS3]